ncbi:hypothetical protein [Kitasatospora sp. NPDC001175]|uniref:hypothetical protein n=1 Tax=Kitasatospora sp. NPDC001175 TaxID=3157103 RepID=UPI003CFE6A0E
MTDTAAPLTDEQLADRIARGLLAAAYSCDGTDCRDTEEECEAAHPVRQPEPWRYVVRIEGSPEGIAAAALAVAQPELDRLRAQVTAAYAFADEMADYCSRNGIAAVYAKRLRERLDAAGSAPTA